MIRQVISEGRYALLVLAAAVCLSACGGQTSSEAPETEATTEAETASEEHAAETEPETEPETTEEETEFEFFAADDTVYVIEESVELMDSMEEDAAVAAVLEIGDSLERNGYSDEWSRVLYEGKECYVSSQAISTTEPQIKTEEEILWNPEWEYADFSKIHEDSAKLYYAPKAVSKGKVACVNAGHGTKGGSSVTTLCHPDGSRKVTGGSTAAGATEATAVSGGTTFLDGTPEPVATLKVALAVKEKLLEKGIDVLMIRESDDVQLDNIARTVMANQNADCHIAIHYDSTETDKGAFYMSVPDVSSYRAMEPVASHWESHHKLGEALIAGLKQNDVKIMGNGSIPLDLTQTSYSTIPSVDIEVGDRKSDYSDDTVEKIAQGLADGIELFFAEEE